MDNYLKIIKLKESIFEKYEKLFINRVGVVPQLYKRNVQPVIWSYAIKIDPQQFTLNRDQIIRKLKSDGIELRPGFISSDLLEIYDEFSPEILPVSRELSYNVLVLPSYSSITESEMEQVADAIFKLRR